MYAMYNQQDATYYNILYCWQSSVRFGRFPRQLSGAQNFTYSILYLSGLVTFTASVVEMYFHLTTLAAAVPESDKHQNIYVPLFELLMIVVEIVRNM
jgi:hypothetical protein